MFSVGSVRVEDVCPTGWDGTVVSDCSVCASFPASEAQTATQQRNRRCCFLRTDEGADIIAGSHLMSWTVRCVHPSLFAPEASGGTDSSCSTRLSSGA
jgi:hypothetical protein